MTTHPKSNLHIALSRKTKELRTVQFAAFGQEWDKLSKQTQKSRINEWQKENEQKTEYKQIDWYET